MIPNDTIKAALVSHYKGITDITNVLTNGASGVKEAQYQGSDYRYPALRVRILRQTPDPALGHCDVARLNGSILVYAEGGSSQPADDLAGIVNDNTHRKLLRGGTVGTDAFYIPRMLCEGLIAATRLNENLWRSEVVFGGNVYPSDEMGGS